MDPIEREKLKKQDRNDRQVFLREHLEMSGSISQLSQRLEGTISLQ